jgi:hypothetical protein
MPQIFRSRLVRRIALAAIGGAALLLADSGVALAGYGPPVPPTPPPGGIFCVVTSQTVGVAGKVIGPLRLGALTATVTIRPRTFLAPVQLTVTQPFGPSTVCPGNSGIGNAGFRGYHAVGGIGIVVQRGGSNFRGFFRGLIIVHFSSPLITRSSLIVAWNGRHFVRVPSAVSRGAATTALVQPANLAVLSRNR